MTLIKYLAAYKLNYFKNNRSIGLTKRSLECPNCASKVKVAQLLYGQSVDCPRCKQQLTYVDYQPYSTPLALALAALVVLFMVTFNTFIEIDIYGNLTSLNIPQMLLMLLTDNYGFLAFLMFVFVFASALLFLLSVIYVYTAFNKSIDLPFLVPITNFMLSARLWVMVDIFLVSVLVAVIKIRGYSEVSYGIAFYALFVYSLLLMRIIFSLSKHWVYQQIVTIKQLAQQLKAENAITCHHCLFSQSQELDNCVVCHKLLYARRTNSLALSWALLIAAIVFYFPANLLPIMVSSSLFSSYSNKILDGIFFLWQQGEFFVATVIFIASILIPLFKIIIVLVLLLGVQFGLLLNPLVLTKLYWLVEKIGRWSMLDVYVIIVLMSVFRTNLATVVPGPATIYFTLVVFLTMLAVHFFDIRLIWDKVRANKS